MICEVCDKELATPPFPGRVRAWVCPDCVAEEERYQERVRAAHRQKVQDYRAEFAKRKRLGKPFMLIPGQTLPPDTAEDVVQGMSDGIFGVEIDRLPDKIIIWVER